MEGLSMLHAEANTRSSAHVLRSLMVCVSEGQPLSKGLETFEHLFGAFAVNIIRVGEASGTLHENLEYLADELKRHETLKKKVMGALIYPAVIVMATLGITIMLTVFIFPKIVPIFASVKATLPWSTRALMAMSDFLSTYGFWVLGIGIAIPIVIMVLARHIRAVHLFIDHGFLRTPILGKVSQYYNLANISRTLALLLKSDVRIVQAIDLVAAATKNTVYKNELLAARERIIKGQNISAQFRLQPRLFPPLFAQMVTVGESTGNLSGTLAYLSTMYEEEINDLTKNLTTLLEPILMVVMGVIVGFIAISIVTPIYSITQNLSPH